MSRLTPPQIFALSAMLAVALISLALWPRGIDIAKAPVIARTVPLPADRSSKPDIPQLQTAALFNPARTSVAVTQTSVPAVPAPALVGLLRTVNGGGLAMLRKADGTQALLKLGQTLDGWQLISVQRQSVTLMQGEQRQTVRLKRDTQLKGAADASPSTQSPDPLPGSTPAEPAPNASTTPTAIPLTEDQKP